MSIALKGKISAIPLLELVQFLSQLQVTGQLEVKGPRGQGRLYLNKGRLVHAVHDEEDGKDAYLALVVSDKGNFVFESDAKTEEKTIDEEAADLVKAAEARISDWKKVAEAVPHFDLVFKMCPKPNSDNIQLTAPEWQIVSQIDGVRTIQEIEENLGLATNHLVEMVSKLAENGLIEATEGKGGGNGSSLTPEDLASLHSELASRMGPVATVILEDISEELGYELKQFPQRKLEDLVDRLADEIPQAAQQESFKKATETLLNRK